MVAEVKGNIVGHIICSRAEVRTTEKVIPVLNFGPISVLPEYQKQGVGKELIISMINKATQLGYSAILFFGRPEYYPQFGFKEACEWSITDAEGYILCFVFGLLFATGSLALMKCCYGREPYYG